jgi:4-hydroxy-tetrahydrodipicolinate synthase
MAAKKFQGILGAPVTPFTRDNKVDFGTFAKQVNFLIEQGLPMVVHPMHVAEAPNLTIEERKELAKCLVETAAGRVPTFVHVSHAGTDIALDLAKYAEKIGATGIVLLPPYYWRPEKEALLDHFTKVAGGTGIKMIAYNNAAATQIEIGHDVLAHLIERLPNFIALKDASFHMKYFTEACRISSELSPEFCCYTGIEYLLSSMPLGGSGAFSACGEVAPKFTLKLYDACLRGDFAAARPLQYTMSKYLALGNFSAVIKYGLEVMGRPVGATRKPIPALGEDMKKKVREILAEMETHGKEKHGW